MSEESFLMKVRELAENVANREGCRLYDVEFVSGSHGKGRVLRVYVDKDGGVGIEDCANVSRGLNLLLDVDDVIPGGAYDLEVSTPGMDRLLRQQWHFEAVLGKKVLVKTFESLEAANPGKPGMKDRRQVSGKLAKVDAEGVVVQIDGAEVFVPFTTLKRAHLVHEFTSQDMKPRNESQRG